MHVIATAGCDGDYWHWLQCPYSKRWMRPVADYPWLEYPMRATGSNAPLLHLLSALYILFACWHRLLFHLSFLFTFFPYLFTPLLIFSWESTRSVSRPEAIRGDQTWALLLVLVYFTSWNFVFLMHDYFCSISLGLLYIFVVISPGFWATVCKTVRPMLSDHCPVLSVCLW